jgi:hypothetical protein
MEASVAVDLEHLEISHFMAIHYDGNPARIFILKDPL